MSQESFEEDLEALTIPDLEARYKSVVGVMARTNDKTALIMGIKDPEAERTRIGEMDRAEDKEDLKGLYRR